MFDRASQLAPPQKKTIRPLGPFRHSFDQQVLDQQAVYWEVSPAGHCPHHEAPEAFNALLLAWLNGVCLCA